MHTSRLIAVSVKQGGYYGRIMRSLNARTGEPVFHVLHLRSACLSCLETLDDPSKCPHLHLALPSHQSQRKQESVTALYGAQNKDVMARETLGISIEGVEGKFHKGVVKQLFAKARVEPPIDPKRIFVAIDPNGGRSGFAICSGIRTGGNLTIVGMEVKQIQNHDQLQELLIGHLNELRRRFPGRAGHPPWLVILPESNLGFESAAIAKMVKPFPRTVCALETKQGSKWGLLLTQDIKVAFADYADEQLRMNAIDFSNNMVSCNLERCMEDLRSQLLNYRAVYTNGHKLTYSGKVDTNGKPALKDDDLVISLQMLLYYSSAAMQGRLKSLAVDMSD